MSAKGQQFRKYFNLGRLFLLLNGNHFYDFEHSNYIALYTLHISSMRLPEIFRGF